MIEKIIIYALAACGIWQIGQWLQVAALLWVERQRQKLRKKYAITPEREAQLRKILGKDYPE
jgi:hypothetical protein